MAEIGLEVARSGYAYSVADAEAIAERVGYPCVLRPSFTLGGAGGGIAHTHEELVSIVSQGLELSPAHEVLVEESIEFVGLQDFRKFRPGKLSGGLLRRLNIACGIAHKPELIFFDEPTVAVDPQSRNAILEGICRLRDEGATVVYTSHYMEEVEQICSRIMIMDGGRVLAQGTNDELKRMIQMGEKIVIEVGEVPSAALGAVASLPHVLDLSATAGQLTFSCEASPHNLTDILDALRSHDVPLGRIYSEPPTLNDVFLEITGRELRD